MSRYMQNETERMYRLKREGSLGPDPWIISTFKGKVDGINWQRICERRGKEIVLSKLEEKSVSSK